ncbi:MAG: tetratricopeptide repeat protein [Sphingobacteriaceae bacterium]|nr:tetratricopeptide repeat protein [Sphingobacteriaceae bacterium]
MIGCNFSGLADTYQIQADYPKALEFYLKGLKLSEEVGDKEVLGNTLCNIASVYIITGKYPAAELHLKKALLFSKEIGSMI